MNRACVRWMVVLVLFVATGCKDSTTQSELPTLRGRVLRARTQALSVSSRTSKLDTASVDAIWAIPTGNARTGLGQRVELALEADGSFTFTPAQGMDYVLALVNSNACTNSTPRAGWTEADIDVRLGCIVGYVSIAEAERKGSMIAIPTSTMTGNTELGDVSSSGTQNDEAQASASLADVAPSFTLGLDGLRQLASVDNTLKTLSWTFANTSDDTKQWYDARPSYSWFAPGTVAAAAKGPTDPGAFLPQSWDLHWQTSIDPTALVNKPPEFIAPHPVDSHDGFHHYPAGTAVGAKLIGGEVQDGLYRGSFSAPFIGAAHGVWRLRRQGDVVAKFDMSVSSPFDAKSGVLDLSHATVYVPSLELVTSDGTNVTGVRITLSTWDGSAYQPANEQLAFRRMELAGSGLSGDGSAGCPAEDEWISVSNDVTDDHLTYSPSGKWVLGKGDATHCGISQVEFTYNLFGAEYRFTWRTAIEPFSIAPLSSSFLPLDPKNGVAGTYVGFDVHQDLAAESWREADLWVVLSDLTSTPAGLVTLGSGEDGTVHLRRQGVTEAWFYLESVGTAALPESFQLAATFTVYDGRPGREKRSRSYPVTWSNTAGVAASSALSVSSYDVATGSVAHGGQRDVKVAGTIKGLAQGDVLTFSPASAAGWPADAYELVEARVSLGSNPAARGLTFKAPTSGDLDYQAIYTFRWTKGGTPPRLSSMAWLQNSAGGQHAPSSDNDSAPTLAPTIPTSQLLLAVAPTALAAADAPLRVEYRATIKHQTTDGFFADRVTIKLPAGAAVIPRTSRWQLGELDENLPEPTVVDGVAEWPVGSFVPVGSDAVVRFEAFIAPTPGQHTATGHASVGSEVVDSTVALGDDAPASATVTVGP